ncbi:MAG: flagellar basal body L-ring protein FlgH [Phycisphaerae bacterium]|nr:flagellar basal body L-ring protein FlgH [Phycisphaerae bacterium]
MKSKNRLCGLLCMAFCMSACLCADARAASIYAKRGQNSKPFYSDDKAYRVGDVLTIVISEDHKVDSKVKRDLERESSRSIDVKSTDFKIEHLIPSVPSLKLQAGSSKSLEGKADYKDERSIEDHITVVVQDIHPNGNLVVLGNRMREISGDKQTLQVSGIVRPSDVTFNNTVRSEQVANFNLVTISDGVSGNYNNPGWLGKLLDKIWPF